MRHLEVRDLWMQKEVREGKIKVFKVLGTANPADLMTKVLGLKDIKSRLGEMNLLVKGKGHETMGEPPEVHWDKNEKECQREVSKVSQDMPVGKKDQALRKSSKVQWADLGDDSDEDMPSVIPVTREIGSVQAEEAEKKNWDKVFSGSHGGELRHRAAQEHQDLSVWDRFVNSKWENSRRVGDGRPPVTEGECLNKMPPVPILAQAAKGRTGIFL